MTASPNTLLKPLTYAVDSQTRMVSIGGMPADTLAATYGTPLYILDELTLRTMMRSYKDAFKRYPAPVTVLFAAKANLNMGLCALVKQEGLGIDVVSGGEFYTALQAKFPLDKVVFNGNNKSIAELEMAISHGIGKISVDNVHELVLIDDVARRLSKKVAVILRITPGIECHTHDYIRTGSIDSKFGIPLAELDQAIATIVGEYSETIDLVGLHAHIGSQIFETSPFTDLAEVMLNLFAGIREQYGLTLTHLNLGGGLGVTYSESDDPPSVDEYARVVIDKLVSHAARINFPLPELILEPGRSLVATSGTTLYTVGIVKTIAQIAKTYVSVDGGMGDNIRPALYGAVYSAEVANKPEELHSRTVTIAGKYCESGDILIREFKAPESIEPGDYLMVYSTGAYNYSMSSNYNRVPRPAMVLVNQGTAQVLVQAETYDDILARDMVPASFLTPQ